MLIMLLAVTPLLFSEGGEEEKEVLVLEHAGRMNRRIQEERVVLYLYEDVRWKKGETTIESDFATYWQDEGWLRLVKDVTVTEPERTITSDTMDYYEEADEVVATGDVVVSSEKGTRELRTTRLLYEREPDRMTATNRPVITVVKEEEEEGDTNTTTLTILGDRVISCGEDSVYVIGQVVVEGDSMNAHCDSAFYDLEGDWIRLRKEPVVNVTGYTAWGREIDLHAPEEKLEEVIVRGEAEAKGEKKIEEDGEEKGEERYWTVADSLVLFFEEEQLHSLNALSMAKSLVLRENEAGSVEKNYVTGDEIRVDIEERKVEKVRVKGMGKGVYVMPPDTLKESSGSARE
jgi:lipopolysaccharide export system protein LptA